MINTQHRPNKIEIDEETRTREQGQRLYETTVKKYRTPLFRKFTLCSVNGDYSRDFTRAVVRKFTSRGEGRGKL